MKEPKYKIGDKVWYLTSESAKEEVVFAIRYNEAQPLVNNAEYYTYCLAEDINETGGYMAWLAERKLFPDKQSLIESL